jgi:hypothetical protein
MEQIPDRASHFFDPDPQLISRVEKQYFFKSLEAAVTRDSDGTSMTEIVMQNVALGPESVGS